MVTRTWAATDACGNNGNSCTQTITAVTVYCDDLLPALTSLFCAQAASLTSTAAAAELVTTLANAALSTVTVCPDSQPQNVDNAACLAYLQAYFASLGPP